MTTSGDAVNAAPRIASRSGELDASSIPPLWCESAVATVVLYEFIEPADSA
jgi:hypothetical protein